MAKIIANGGEVEIRLPCRLVDYLSESGWKASQVVVELNGEVVGRSKVGAVDLSDGDRLEVIVPVAGG